MSSLSHLVCLGISVFRIGSEACGGVGVASSLPIDRPVMVVLILADGAVISRKRHQCMESCHIHMHTMRERSTKKTFSWNHLFQL
ncbi:hypothetical protein B0H19DRAFT_1185389 [Mycena capillaripes]|nr:hypothetical protein B0H19DRAFT_1185389 [Mycena capillaripes]